MIQLNDLGTFESVPHIVTDIVTGNINAFENALIDSWDIVLDLRPKMESYVKDTEKD